MPSHSTANSGQSPCVPVTRQDRAEEQAGCLGNSSEMQCYLQHLSTDADTMQAESAFHLLSSASFSSGFSFTWEYQRTVQAP